MGALFRLFLTWIVLSIVLAYPARPVVADVSQVTDNRQGQDAFYKVIESSPKETIKLVWSDKENPFHQWIVRLLPVKGLDKTQCRAFTRAVAEMNFTTSGYRSSSCDVTKSAPALFTCSLSCTSKLNHQSLASLRTLGSILSACEEVDAAISDLMTSSESKDLALFLLIKERYEQSLSLKLLEEAMKGNRPELKMYILSTLYDRFAGERSLYKLAQYLPMMKLSDSALIEMEFHLHRLRDLPPIDFCSDDVVKRVEKLITDRTYLAPGAVASCYTKSSIARQFALEVLSSGVVAWLDESITKLVTIPECQRVGGDGEMCPMPYDDYKRALEYRLGKYYALGAGENLVFNDLMNSGVLGFKSRFVKGQIAKFCDRTLYTPEVSSLIESLPAEKRFDVDTMILAQLDLDYDILRVTNSSRNPYNQLSEFATSDPKQVFAMLESNPLATTNFIAENCNKKASCGLDLDKDDTAWHSGETIFDYYPCNYKFDMCSDVLFKRNGVSDKNSFWNKACKDYSRASLPLQLLIAPRCITFLYDMVNESTNNLLSLLNNINSNAPRCLATLIGGQCPVYEESRLTKLGYASIQSLNYLHPIIDMGLTGDQETARRIIGSRKPLVIERALNIVCHDDGNRNRIARILLELGDPEIRQRFMSDSFADTHDEDFFRLVREFGLLPADKEIEIIRRSNGPLRQNMVVDCYREATCRARLLKEGLLRLYSADAKWAIHLDPKLLEDDILGFHKVASVFDYLREQETKSGVATFHAVHELLQCKEISPIIRVWLHLMDIHKRQVSDARNETIDLLINLGVYCVPFSSGSFNLKEAGTDAISKLETILDDLLRLPRRDQSVEDWVFEGAKWLSFVDKNRAAHYLMELANMSPCMTSKELPEKVLTSCKHPNKMRYFIELAQYHELDTVRHYFDALMQSEAPKYQPDLVKAVLLFDHNSKRLTERIDKYSVEFRMSQFGKVIKALIQAN